MPHPKGLDIPPPEHEQEFEDLCVDVLAARLAPIVAPERYGRRGQAQFGMDTILQTGAGLEGFQCKRVASFTMSEFEAELAKTANYPNRDRLVGFTVLATCAADGRVQDSVSSHNAKTAIRPSRTAV